jgi:hypothetical protein
MASIPTNAGAVVLNITAIGYGTKGWLSVYLNSQSVPATSTVNFDTSEYALANGTVMRVGTDGKVCVNVGSVNSTPGNSHVILDVTGYLTSTGLTSIPMLPSPQRVVDTRTLGGPLITGASRCFSMAGVATVPANAVAVINVTAVGYGAKGWLEPAQLLSTQTGVQGQDQQRSVTHTAVLADGRHQCFFFLIGQVAGGLRRARNELTTREGSRVSKPPSTAQPK